MKTESARSVNTATQTVNAKSSLAPTILIADHFSVKTRSSALPALTTTLVEMNQTQCTVEHLMALVIL